MERVDKRVVLTLVDESVRIFGSDCQSVLVTPDLGSVDVRVGVNGNSKNETFKGVNLVLYEGPLSRLVRQTTDGELNIQYPQRLARVELDLPEGNLIYQFEGDKNLTEVREVNALVFE